MKITNQAGLPQAVFEAISQKEYTKEGANLSVTELIDPPRVVALKKKHDAEIEVEAEGLLATFLGTAFHKAIEAGTQTGTAERRLKMEVGGWTISGGMDHYHDGVLTDYKTATTWKTMFSKGRVEEWEKQLNVYAQILRSNGHPVHAIRIFVYFKDWTSRGLSSATKSGKVFEPNKKGGYPAKAWLHFDLILWPEEATQIYIERQVKAHQLAEKELPNCEPEDTWNGRRCSQYCVAAPFCLQYQSAKKTGLLTPAQGAES